MKKLLDKILEFFLCEEGNLLMKEQKKFEREIRNCQQWDLEIRSYDREMNRINEEIRRAQKCTW